MSKIKDKTLYPPEGATIKEPVKLKDGQSIISAIFEVLKNYISEHGDGPFNINCELGK